jgi:hypothetical protein
MLFFRKMGRESDMIIKRCGAASDHGVRKVKLEKLEFKWDGVAGTLRATNEDPVADFSANARHRYRLDFTLEEQARMIEALGANCREIDSEEFSKIFAKVLPSLIRITNAAAQAS